LIAEPVIVGKTTRLPFDETPTTTAEAVDGATNLGGPAEEAETEVEATEPPATHPTIVISEQISFFMTI
jgi:hypothetical protein